VKIFYVNTIYNIYRYSYLSIKNTDFLHHTHANSGRNDMNSSTSVEPARLIFEFVWNILTGHCFFPPPNSLVSFISKTDGRNITNGHNITEILLTVRYHIHDQLETVFRIFVVVQDIFNKLKNQSRWFYGSGTIHVISSRISMSMV
jgi:hypothetical protein